VIVAIVVVAVIVVLALVMAWADRRERAKGHVHRTPGEMKSAIRAAKERKIALQLQDKRRPPRH
jgi:FtsZ-interacting cell division protein ZipA